MFLISTLQQASPAAYRMSILELSGRSCLLQGTPLTSDELDLVRRVRAAPSATPHPADHHDDVFRPNVAQSQVASARQQGGSHVSPRTCAI